ncbi:5-aminolevulinate synthase, mitochondrial-like [Pollicipes pollicipes]|uniref:5-aminolevulinate synthase, mitochondrial-like n=1 Tax=Pollicipes pollicipes TaxID=41117 RepID=UPI0018850E40|nr:5-aminolevulinate synthase, mitochondrial-like [Pollicipes pollicipes]
MVMLWYGELCTDANDSTDCWHLSLLVLTSPAPVLICSVTAPRQRDSGRPAAAGVCTSCLQQPPSLATGRASVQVGPPRKRPKQNSAMMFGNTCKLMMKARCPFLRMFPQNYVQSYGASLIFSYGSSCPVVSKKMSAIAAEPAFDYERFFADQIQRKKEDHSYRIFRKVLRNAEQFPAAKEYSFGERDVTVWCSNDYLGMSRHPAVTGAVM